MSARCLSRYWTKIVHSLTSKSYMDKAYLVKSCRNKHLSPYIVQTHGIFWYHGLKTKTHQGRIKVNTGTQLFLYLPTSYKLMISSDITVWKRKHIRGGFINVGLYKTFLMAIFSHAQSNYCIAKRSWQKKWFISSTSENGSFLIL